MKSVIRTNWYIFAVAITSLGLSVYTGKASLALIGTVLLCTSHVVDAIIANSKESKK